jgi:hypothetical protein
MLTRTLIRGLRSSLPVRGCRDALKVLVLCVCVRRRVEPPRAVRAGAEMTRTAASPLRRGDN